MLNPIHIIAIIIKIAKITILWIVSPQAPRNDDYDYQVIQIVNNLNITLKIS